jgi:hypothetical protein
VELVFRLNLIPNFSKTRAARLRGPPAQNIRAFRRSCQPPALGTRFPSPVFRREGKAHGWDDGAEDKLLRGRWRDWCRLRRSGSGHGRETEASKRRDFPLRVVKTPSAKHVPELSSSPSAAGTCTFRIPSLFLHYPMQSVPKLTSAPVASTPGPWTQASNSAPPLIRYRFQLRRPMTFEPSACKPPAACSGRRAIAGDSQAPTL